MTRSYSSSHKSPAKTRLLIALGAIAALLSLQSTVRADGPDIPATAPADPVKTGVALHEKQEADRINRLWKQFWKDYASRCILLDGKVTIFPNFDPQYPNSRGVTVKELVNPPSGSDATPMSPQEAEVYALVIPQIATGEYGYIVSGEVVKVFGPQDAVMRNIRFVDSEAISKDYDAEYDQVEAAISRYQRQTWAKTHQLPEYNSTRRMLVDQLDARYKLRHDLIKLQDNLGYNFELHIKGFETSKMSTGARWTGNKTGGIQIAIVGAESFGDYYDKDKQRLIAVPIEKFKTPLTEDQFKKVLADHNMTIPQFVDSVLTERRKDSVNFKTHVMENLKNSGDADAKAPPAKDSN